MASIKIRDTHDGSFKKLPVVKGDKGEVGPVGPVGPQGPMGPEYIHPDTHSAAMIEETADRVFLTEKEKTDLTQKKHDFIHVQEIPKSEWLVQHGMDKFPSVTVIDSIDRIVVGQVNYIDKNILSIAFSSSFSGKAFLN